LRTIEPFPGSVSAGVYDVDTATLMSWYAKATLIRAFETRAYQVHRSGEIRGSLHASTGFEVATVALFAAALSPGDLVFSHHRPLGHCIAVGMEPRRIMAELFGRAEGYSKGKGGSKHIADVTTGFLSAGGIIAGMLPIAVGTAYANKYFGSPKLVMALLGDGAVNQGVFHEAMNLSVVLETPVLFVCENNHWAENTSADAVTAAASITSRAAAYGMPSVCVKAGDALNVYSVARVLAQQVRDSMRPAFLEVDGHRIGSHSVGVIHDARSDDEAAQAVEMDPSPKLATLLRERGVADQEIDRAHREADAMTDDAIEYARNLSPQGDGTAYEDIYAASAGG
jgi:TPP-dependent pyruvate/acetoin dehydrogenase alpha subunit